jgi:TolB-like protein/DNA-binding winged helix-turn-helix (wHTH) protein
MAMTIPSGRVRFGVFEVDLRSGELHKQGIKIKFHDQPFQVLAMLLEHPGELVTREQLQQKLWPSDTFVDFDVGLNSAIKRLRDTLGDTAESPRYIETLPRRGYRFIAAVERIPSVPYQDLPVHTEHAAEQPMKALAVRRRSKLWFVTGVLAAMLVLFVGLNIGGLRQRFVRTSAARTVQCVAVLPLENLSGDPEQEYFADGMTDALITELAQVRGLTVISRTSVMHYKGARKTLPEIARELGVDAVVEGTVARNGGEVKISAQLIRASTDTHLWAASYARVQQDVLRLQAEVAREVTHQISDQLVPVENKAGARPTVNPDAYDAYLKGVFFLNKNPEGVRTAIRYFQAAIEKDRNFAASYSGLATCYATLSYMSEMASGEAYAAAKEAAEKAVTLDDKLAQAHTALAWIAESDWDWMRAETEYKRAIQVNPNSTDAHMGYSNLLLILGKSEESVQEERAATILDPLSVNTLNIGISSAYYRRQYDEGLIKARTAIELYPQLSFFHVFLSNFYAAQGKDQLSAKEILLAEETSGAPPERLAALRAANEMAGLKGLRRKRIELNKKMAAKQSMNAYDIAIDCAAVGDEGQAIAWLERALRARDPKMSLIGVEPIFDGIRSDPRFASLLRQMGLNSTYS